jgi:hypothetical protein
VVARELDQDPVKFHDFYRMDIESFKLLVQIVGPQIRKNKGHKFPKRRDRGMLIFCDYRIRKVDSQLPEQILC